VYQTAEFKLEKQGRMQRKVSEERNKRNEGGIVVKQACGSMKDMDKRKAVAL
jgi:hypothetical protein